MAKKWRHKGVHRTNKPMHNPKPYARIGENRCAICGDEIELIDDHEERSDSSKHNEPRS